ncbi:hypothetical protein [Afifella marina]|uniref:Uncharacterized protein n=1 Tax=Afifella marina DSM 2698 TaxID=1120955 RepID=A0A1G5MVC3_AFIMA|nr:hypothetical protein [Afifella marina]MBK1622066.1 hypothetical protein [Afifella marina DSM 2698]MBK1627859.1 hypothetical protein [Afifella marina]MBK5918076.1 hypothetical protein [Afifella marina]RAI19851.1 hypothetical protein CH311_11095 [Afifella marina DSM 2698]SCZ29177.1 hypothetical protein SAMN03080610_01096 [Afifella marina DSM 2698]
MRLAIAAISLVVAGAASAGGAQRATIADILAAEGCAIGPHTEQRVSAAGLDVAALDAMVADAEKDAQTVRTGGWIVLPTSLCKIRPPAVRSEIRLDDPEVVALTTAIDAYADLGDRGCFIDGPAIMERVQATRGWDADKAMIEYVRFIAENLRSGDLAFYQASPFHTPPGFQILTGDCADVPEIEAIRQSQAARDREFDALIREDAPKVDCTNDTSPSYEFMASTHERKIPNAWTFFEVKVMTIGAGWYEGTNATQMGSPRPPLCRYR